MASASSKQVDAKRPIYIKRVKKVAGGHHGGAWKVAYADFVTAMMAFFMVMWLITAVSKDQRAAIFDYFKNPSMEPGKSVKPAPGQMGPGGASTAAVNLGGGLDSPKTSLKKTEAMGTTVMTSPASPIDLKTKEQKAAEAAEAAKLLEKKQLDALMADLKQAISKSQALEPFKDQLLLDITPEGLRIQILDAQNRPMFDLGSSRLKNYSNAILREVSGYLQTVPNQISITGHTDATPYAGVTGFTNWDLSTDRANAARRSLESAGLPTQRISRVVGMGSSVLFDKANPRSAVNRRISIVVMTREAAEESMKTDQPNLLSDTTATPITDARVMPDVSISRQRSFSIPGAGKKP
ncbi:MAG TPA: flagellar motor protein MotB [Steroidobacteraceae bacterium]|nr:flagellar motor protein MotB [Steroidobacteraceae bacterium]